eukprot:CAMPEP_0203696140 /NCGR_PEP_ID=MMETSP0091-20130426/7427_1 /ASSEMBLY_ACC=CAM_ASM_001089 /TAXON_ID=426623 /ORGANISM="Chaetoceros affinis, Strain CCMP159" /LENGTH=430 /DNA_ID=CAMNT_0050567857 /DNA_START=159 /DNA_END=1452 /DNA_ORIENTATION=-
MIEDIDTEMEVTVTSIKISPIVTSRQVSADLSVPMPIDPLRMSSPITSSANVNVSGNFSFNNIDDISNSTIHNSIRRTSWERTPLQQQTSVIEDTPRTLYHSPLQRGPRKDSYFGYHDRRRHDRDYDRDYSFDYSEGANYGTDNDENRNGINRFANFRRTFMQDDRVNANVNNMDVNVNNTPRHYNPNPSRFDNDDRMFICDIDAPSDERDEDESIHEILSMVEQQQQEYDQHHHNMGENNYIHESEEVNEYNDNNSGGGEVEDETEEERMQREEEESLALARQLMAEEAMASYAESSNFLRQHANEYSEEDLRALEGLIAEEDPMADHHEVDDEVMGENEHDNLDLSYEALLQLGERIGDVKSERWAMRAQDEIAKLETVSFDWRMAHGKDEMIAALSALSANSSIKKGNASEFCRVSIDFILIVLISG